MEKYQKTISSQISYTGIGLHTGNKTTITFKPAPVNHWISFVRKDLPDLPEVPADIEHVIDINRGTTLGKGTVKVYTVEHVLAAVIGLEIDNLIIELDSNEPPVGDGSSLPFVDALLKAQIEEQEEPKKFIEVDTPLLYSDKERGVDIAAFPSDDLRITFMIDYRNPALGTQYTSLFSLKEEFVKEFAPARTFCFLHELEELKAKGLIKGGGLDNALIICDYDMSQKDVERIKPLFGLKEEAFLGKSGILNDVPLRFYNEPARHKALDLLGDISLIGVPLKAHILAARSGHAANVALVKKLRQLYEKKLITVKYQEKKNKGDYFLDASAIQKIMPHRYPFLLVDRVIDIVPRERVVAIKNVTLNEPFFVGHFPGHPIMPGVLIIESMAQAGGILLLNTVENPENKVVYFMGMDGVRFRKPVLPGDQLRLELEMIQFRKGGACKMQGKAFLGDELAAEAILMATVVEK
ncbi:MAG: bifunctional UDP-3-O-[3-hydroxymyristoyl] N-acetylglucosamine deacetylase/3-hydroxyacyl-ACP dehydratase [candidate division Zixibacteria bacterium]|nr:bifunctional UDP-3-O-[3-hydroxymyristoyl] N-acetylglucosamine deacetylase/3-hydroxyacyl-ACP dehydratase [candidate division Zixibacteria bacterium]